MKRSNIIAFDLHGVLDTYGYFRNLLASTYEQRKDKVYIISGQLFDNEVQEFLHRYHLNFDKYFSITQEIINEDPSLITWIDGKPYAEDKIWNPVKARICDREGVEILFDDSTRYSKYFKDIDTIYAQVHNGVWKESGRDND